MFKVIHIRNMDKRNPQHVYCGRPSILSNPAFMRTESDRDDVCETYKIHFNSLLINSKQFRAAIESLRVQHQRGDVSLVCYCAPKRCHCETIAAHLNEEIW